MSFMRLTVLGSTLFLGISFGFTNRTEAQVTIKQILSVKPIQADVEYDTPDPNEFEKCKLTQLKEGKATGYLVTGPAGQTLRRFMDVDGIKDAKGDTFLDEFSFFKDGLEVYRESDTTGNNKKDEFRWFNFGGSRWGIDKNEDGKIDSWRQISPEEVSRLAIKALISQDAALMSSLLVTKDDLKQLGIKGSLEERLLAAVADSATKMKKVAAGSKILTANASWARFDATTAPKTHAQIVVPAASIGATKDVTLYENVIGLVDTGNPAAPGVVMIGELVKIGEAWKMTMIPVPFEGNVQIDPGMIVNEPLFRGGKEPSAESLPPEVQALLKNYQELMNKRPQPNATEKAFLAWEKEVEKVCGELAEKFPSAEDKEKFTRQLIEHISTAIEKDRDAVSRLRKLSTRVEKDYPGSQSAMLVKYRIMYAEYTEKMDAAAKDNQRRQKIHETWLNELADFLEENPTFEQSPEIILELAQEFEFAGKIAKAENWYDQLIEKYPESVFKPRADGAKRRLGLVGKPLILEGPGLAGGKIDVKQFRGKVVAVVFWDTASKQHADDLASLKALYEAHHANGFEILGVNLDAQKETVTQFVKGQAVKWPQIYSSGGQESPLAIRYNIFTVPTMFLVDREGNILSRGASIADLKTMVPEAVEKK